METAEVVVEIGYMASYINSLTWWSVISAVVTPLVWIGVQLYRKKVSLGSNDELSKLGFSMISKAASGFSLPAAPALAFCAAYPELLNQVTSLSLALILAAFAVVIIFLVDFFRL